jgi:hypothetical protein
MQVTKLEHARGVFNMRFAIFTAAIVLAHGSAAMSANAAPPAAATPPAASDQSAPPAATGHSPHTSAALAKRTVYLTGPSTLEALQRANPSHYARAMRVIAAADDVCKPGRPETDFVSLDAKEVSCAGGLVLTSNPPKRQIGFTLDDVRYVAVVTLTDDPPKIRPLQ